MFETMIWQDVVLTFGQFIFSIALLPTIFGKDKPTFATSVMTGTVMVVYVYTLYTLDLYLSTFATALTATCWITLAYQRHPWRAQNHESAKAN